MTSLLSSSSVGVRPLYGLRASTSSDSWPVKDENHCIQADLIAQPLDVIGVFENLIRGQINSREPIIGHWFPSFRIYIRRRI